MIANIISGLLGLGGKFLDFRSAKESNVHDEQAAAYQQYAAEFQQREGRTWWDSFVDGLNRLPRPLFAFAVILMFVYAPMDPLHFAQIMQAYGLVPEWLAIIVAQIILLYMGGRMLEKWPSRMKGPSLADIKEVTETQKAIAELRTFNTEENDAPNLRLSDAETPEAAKRPSGPLPSIQRWNEGGKRPSEYPDYEGA